MLQGLLQDRNRALRGFGIISFVALLLFFSGFWRLVFAQATPGFTKVNTLPITTTSFTSGNLVDGGFYNVQVTAVNQAGESGPSTTVSGMVPATGTHTFTITWTASATATSYNVYDQLVTTPNPPGAPELTIN